MKFCLRKLASAATLLVAVLAQAAMPDDVTSGFFVNAPHKVMPLLSKNARLDMLDYYKSGLSTATSNGLKGRSRITAITPSSIDVQISDNTSLQFVYYDNKPDHYIVVIETVQTPVTDSSIRVFDTNWNEIPVRMPEYTDFIDKDKRKEARKAEAPAMTFTEARYNPESKRFVFTDHSKDYYYKNEIPEVVSCFVPEISLKLKTDSYGIRESPKRWPFSKTYVRFK